MMMLMFQWGFEGGAASEEEQRLLLLMGVGF